MLNFKNKKGFTLIELLIVIAIIALLVLLAAPKMLGFTEDAKLAQIKNDVKAYESAIAQELLDNEKFFDGLDLANNEDLIKFAEEENLFNKKGKVNSEDIIDSYFEIDGDKVKVDSKLKGKLFTNKKGLVLYYEENFGLSKDENTNEDPKEEVYLATDEDFEWMTDSSGYTAANQTGKGYYKYIGEGQSIIEIPHEINGHPMTSYYKMFFQAGKDVEKIISTNEHINGMSNMFYNFQAETLDLSNFDTSKVTDMSSMFSYSQAKILDLSSFDTSSVTDMKSMFSVSQATSIKFSGNFNTSNVTNMSFMFMSFQAKTLDLSSFNTSRVTDMSYMFYGAKATTGYAKTQEDADNFNNSSDKPTSLGFKIK